MPGKPGWLRSGRYSATSHQGKWFGSSGGLTTGRSMRRRGTTTRLATRAAPGPDDGAGDAGGVSVGSGRRLGGGDSVASPDGAGDGATATTSGGSW